MIPMRGAGRDYQLAEESRSTWPRCCVCGDVVDPREVEEGGDPDGCELSDGRWVCSRKHYDIALKNWGAPDREASR